MRAAMTAFSTDHERGHDRRFGPTEADAVMVGQRNAPVMARLLASAHSMAKGQEFITLPTFPGIALKQVELAAATSSEAERRPGRHFQEENDASEAERGDPAVTRRAIAVVLVPASQLGIMRG
jgi:hypothetical protein